MAGSLNRVLLIGNLGQDPELRYTPNQVPVVTFSIATTEYRTGADGQKQEQTEWHRVVVWNKLAENCAKFLAKGRTVFIEGKMQTRSWDDKASGQKRYTTEIVAQNVQFLSQAGQGQSSSRGEYGSNNYGNRDQQHREAPQQQGQGVSSYGSSFGGQDFDMPPASPSQQPSPMSSSFGGDTNLDDIPF
jgi:single-strand DNA-binding protein